MPTYEYACRQCGNHLEVVQKFTDDPLTTCPGCSGALRKVFGNIGIAFKGSGFYKTDSRSSDGNGNGKAGDGKAGDKAAEKTSESSGKGDKTTSSGGSTTSTGSKDGGAKADAPKAAS